MKLSRERLGSLLVIVGFFAVSVAFWAFFAVRTRWAAGRAAISSNQRFTLGNSSCTMPWFSSPSGRICTPNSAQFLRSVSICVRDVVSRMVIRSPRRVLNAGSA